VTRARRCADLSIGAARLLIALTLHPAGPLHAQDRSFTGDIDDVLDDIFLVWSAPFNASARDLHGLALVAGIAAPALLLDAEIQRWLAAHPESLPVALTAPFREGLPFNHLGRTHVLAPASAALWLAGLAFDVDALRDAGLGCAASNVATTLARFSFSYLVGRARPSETDDPYTFHVPAFAAHEERSFPGGHAANIMSCVSFWTRRFELGAAEPLLFTLASLVAFGRTVDGAHWTSDTLLGMSWGFAVGRAVAGESRKRENSREERLRLRPYVAFTVRF
jgi:membrane-associated phospholipid phosphatase